MSEDMYLMNEAFLGAVENDDFYDYSPMGFDEVLCSFLASDVELYKSRSTDEPLKIRAVIENQTTDNPQFANLRQILCRLGTNLQCGNYVKKSDGWWIIPYLPGSNGIYEKAFLWYCNHTLRFHSPITDEIVEYPVYTENATRYNSGERENHKMAIGTSQHVVYMPNNEETILINNGMRFIFDLNESHPTVLRVTQVDTTSYAFGDEVRLLRLTMLEDQYNPVTDDAQLGVADHHAYNSHAGNRGSTYYG